MATLADINKTLQQQITLMLQQQEVSEKTSQGIESVKNRIADVLNQQKSDKLDKLEQARESRSKIQSQTPTGFTSGLTQGSGASGIASMLSGFLGGMFSRAGGLMGMLTGALGLAAGKAIKWTVIGGLIMSFFGDEILAFAEGLENLTGIDLNLDNKANLLALTVAIGAIVPALLRTATGWILKSVVRPVALSALKGAWSGITSLATAGAKATSRMLPTRPGQAVSGVVASTVDDAALTAARLAEQQAASAAAKASERAGAAKLFSKTGKPLAGTAADAVRRKLMRDAEAASIRAAEASAARKAAETAAASVAAPAAKSMGWRALGAVGRLAMSGPALALQLALTPSELGLDTQEQIDIAINRMFEEKGIKALGEVRSLLSSPLGQDQLKKFGNIYPHWNQILQDDKFAQEYASAKFLKANPSPFRTNPRAPDARSNFAIMPSAGAQSSIVAQPGQSGSALSSGAGAGGAGGVTINNFYGGPGGSSSGGSAVPIPVPAVAASTLDLLDGGGRR